MGLKERLGNLTREQRALLAEQLSQEFAKSGRESNKLPKIVDDPQHRHEPFELTDLQHAYLIGRSRAFDLGNIASKVYLELECTNFDLPRFQTSWLKLIERHDALRLIVNENHQQQILDKTPPWEIAAMDLSGKDETAIQTALREIKHKILTEIRPADQWPLFDVQVTRLDDRRSRVHLGLDLLNFDAGSIAILMKEMTRFYEHPELKLSPLALSFRDYLAAEKAFWETEYYKRSETYWMGRVDIIPPGPDLPLARTPSDIADTGVRFTRRIRLLDAARWNRLKQQTVKAGLTPTVIMLAVYSEILGMWSRSQKFTINIPFFNRLPIHPQVQDIIGDFTAVESGRSTVRTRDRFWKRPDGFTVSCFRTWTIGSWMVSRCYGCCRKNVAVLLPMEFRLYLPACSIIPIPIACRDWARFVTAVSTRPLKFGWISQWMSMKAI